MTEPMTDLQKASVGRTLDFLKEFQTEVENVTRDIDQLFHEYHAGLTLGADASEIFAMCKINYLHTILINFQKRYPFGIQM